MARRRSSWRRIKLHRSYTVDEISQLTGYAKITVRRWIKAGIISAIDDRKPILVLGADVREHFRQRSRKRRKLGLSECYCLKCRAARRPALGMADYMPLTETTGNLRALCEVCSALMHKAISLRALPQLASVFEVTVKHADERLADTPTPSPDDHIR